MKNFVFIICLLVFIYTNAQIDDFDYCYDPNNVNWEWWNPKSDWKLYTIQHPNGFNSFPFTTGMGNDLLNIDFAKDYLPEDGWLLVARHFGCPEHLEPNPRFILYNKYKSILRLFAFHNYPGASSFGLIIVDQAGSNKTSILTANNDFSLSNDKYPANSLDQAINQVESFPNNRWYVSDFIVMFDEKAQINTDNSALNFKIFGVSKSNIELESDVNLISKSITIKGNKNTITPPANPSNGNWIVEGHEALQKLKYNEWGTYIDNTINGINSTAIWLNTHSQNATPLCDFSNDLFAFNEKLKNSAFIQILKGGAKMIGVADGLLQIGSGLIKLFGGKPKKDTPQSPTVSQEFALTPFSTLGKIKTGGTITTSHDFDDFTFPLPGNKSTFSYYTCPIGVYNLKKMPLVTKRIISTNYQVFSHPYAYYPGSGPGAPIGNPQTLFPAFTNNISNPQYYNSFRIEENLEISVNAASNLELISAKAALVAKYFPKKYTNTWYLGGEFFYNEEFEYDLFNPKSSYKTWPALLNDDFIIVKDDATNIDLEYLRMGIYHLCKTDGSQDITGKYNKRHEYRTSFVNINEIKNLSMTVHQNANLYLKLILIFKEKNNLKAPLQFFENTYMIDNFVIDNYSNKKFPFTFQQLKELKIPNDFVEDWQVNSEYFEPHHDIVSTIRNNNIIYNKILTSGNYNNNFITLNNSTINAIQNINIQADYAIIIQDGVKISAQANSVCSLSIQPNPNEIITADVVNMSDIVKYYAKNGTSALQAFDYPIDCDCSPTQNSPINDLSMQMVNKEKFLEKEFNIEIFPNPNNGLFSLNIYNLNDQIINVKIFDILNENIFNFVIDSMQKQIDLSFLPSGVYILNFQIKNQILVKKIIIQK